MHLLRLMTLTLLAMFFASCSSNQQLPPPPQVVEIRPPEVITRCNPPEPPPTLPALPAGATVPRAVVVQRDQTAGSFYLKERGEHAACAANAQALRQMLGYADSKPQAPSSAPPGAATPPPATQTQQSRQPAPVTH